MAQTTFLTDSSQSMLEAYKERDLVRELCKELIAKEEPKQKLVFRQTISFLYD